jgi:hypothetical protein
MATTVLASTESPRAQVRGVAEALPPGERVLWEGGPAPRAIARHLLFVRPLAAYFAVIVGWWVVANLERFGTADFFVPVAMQLALVGAVLGGIVAVARAIARSTTYAITDRRIVMKLGLVFPLTVNIPLKYVVGAQARRFADGTGQIALQLDAKEKLAWIVLFPHVRPWRFAAPEPLLRGLTDPAQVGAILRSATLGQ